MTLRAGRRLDNGWTGKAGQWLDNGWTNVAYVTVEGWTGWTRPAISGKNRVSRQPVENLFSQVRCIYINNQLTPTYESRGRQGWTRPACPAFAGAK